MLTRSNPISPCFTAIFARRNPAATVPLLFATLALAFSTSGCRQVDQRAPQAPSASIAPTSPLAATPQSYFPDQKVCPAYSIALNNIEPDYDGQWQGITVASDGNCYFASSTHSPRHGAGFFRFDPQTRELKVLAEDITLICNEDPAKTGPQGKVHSPIVECDGWLYFTTHLSNYWDEAKDAYRGAHVLGYELKTGQFRDFGVVHPRFTIYSAIGVDPARKKLYVHSVPMAKDDQENDGCHIYRIDIKSGKMDDLGKVVQKGWGAAFWFYVDADGNCWLSEWSRRGTFPEGGRGNLYRVAADSGKIERFDNVLPPAALWPDGQLQPEDQQVQRSWSWAAALPGRKQCLFTMGYGAGNDERLWLFDPSKDPKEPAAFQAVGYVGPTFLPMALAGDRVYYIQRGDLVSHRGYSGEAQRDKDPGQSKHDDFHLKSISLRPEDHGAVIDHGLIVDQFGRTPRMIDSLAADEHGRVYCVGSWRILPGDQPTLQYDWTKPVKDFRPTHRAQFFAAFDVSKDLLIARR